MKTALQQEEDVSPSRVSAMRLLGLLTTLCLAVAVAGGMVWAFAEEPLYFRDPYSGETGSEWEEISTIHDDLTYVLALAAGFSVSDAIRLQIWDQLVDSEEIGPGEAVSYTNCEGGAFPPMPDPDSICGLKPHSNLIWPLWASVKEPDRCITSRFGPYSPFFHFPHDNQQELGALHDWAWGLTDTLRGYEAYAWGGPAEFTVMQASCLYTRTAVITTGMEAGSLPAFATYLHSLADHYSHRDCIAHMDELGMPWATHTLRGHPPCDYNPAMPDAADVHGREFYTYTDSLRTDAAIRHIYAELTARGLQREGEYYPLSPDTPLVALEGAPTLSDTLSTFVHAWEFDEPAQRRAWADQIAAAVLAQRRPIRRLYLPRMQSPTSATTAQGGGPLPDAPASAQDWGQPITDTTSFTMYQKSFVYGATPFAITDIRDDEDYKVYSDKESYEIRALTVYRAGDATSLLERRPVILFVHGGAWVDGYRDWYDFAARAFTGEMGWVTVVIDYRLTSNQVFLADRYCPDRATCQLPENASNRTKAAWYPDNLEDVAAAFIWVRDHIAENGGDPGNIFLFGHSAGGHLASLFATHSDYASLGPSIRGVISMSGAYDLTTLNQAFWQAAVSQTFQGGFGNTRQLQEASPAGYVHTRSSLPPFYLLYAEDEMLNLTQQAISFHNLLQTQGFASTLTYLPGYGHTSEMEAIAYIDAEPTQHIIDWVSSLLHDLYLPAVWR
ncbi:MAG: alpha/beta hydrolase [Caldilineae bacterium]|nr:MAG: alpha/beta hydrolase [Caldilineae bacterium]